MLKKLNLRSLQKKLASSNAPDKPTQLARRALSALMRQGSSSSLGRSTRGDASALPFSLDTLRSNALAAMPAYANKCGLEAFHAGPHAHAFTLTALLYLCAHLKAMRCERQQRRLAQNNEEANASLVPLLRRHRSEKAHWLKEHASVYVGVVLRHGRRGRDAQREDMVFFELVHRYVQLVMEQAFRDSVHGDIEAELGGLFRTRKFNREKHKEDEGAAKLLPLRELYRLKYEGDTVVNRKKLYQYQRRPEIVPGVVHERSPVLTAIMPSPREKARRVAAYRPGFEDAAARRSRRAGARVPAKGSSSKQRSPRSPQSQRSNPHGSGPSQQQQQQRSAGSLSPPPAPRGGGSNLPAIPLSPSHSNYAGDGGGGGGLHGIHGSAGDLLDLDPSFRFSVPRDLSTYMAMVPWSTYNPEEGPVPLSTQVGVGTQGSSVTQGPGGSSHLLRSDRTVSRLSGFSRNSGWVIDGRQQREASMASIGSERRR